MKRQNTKIAPVTKFSAPSLNNLVILLKKPHVEKGPNCPKTAKENDTKTSILHLISWQRNNILKSSVIFQLSCQVTLPSVFVYFYSYMCTHINVEAIYTHIYANKLHQMMKEKLSVQIQRYKNSGWNKLFKL